jgi:hypothetical protein
MTVKKRHTVTLDEIIAFDLTCNNCRITSSIPVGSNIKISGECPHCKAHWLSLIGIAFEQFKQGMAEIIRHSKDEDVGCGFAVEVKGKVESVESCGQKS